MLKTKLYPTLLALLALVLMAGCSKKTEDKSSSAESKAAEDKEVSLQGAGATFPYPLYSKWMAEYNRLNPKVKINYQSIGSGGGIKQITAETVDFGASDAPLKPDEEAKVTHNLFHIPTTIGSIVVTYNQPALKEPVKLTQAALVDIFSGKITKWNDKAIADANPGVSLPGDAISVVYRSDGSGTTAVFTDYLGKVSAEFRDKIGVGKTVSWPVGLGAKGNEGVAGQVKTTPGAIGYVELAYAKQTQMPIALLQNKSGTFVTPDKASVSAAAADAKLSDKLTASITDSAAPNAYPIAAFTYLLVYEDAKDATRGEALAKFLWWALHDGQNFSEALDYSPLPATVVAKVEGRLKELRSGDRRFLAIP